VSQSAIAERYALAILGLADEGGQLAETVEQLRNAAGAYRESAELRAMMASPAVDASARDQVLKDIGGRLGLSTLSLNALRLMARRGRLSLLPDIADMLGRLADKKAGVLRATVTSARPLSEDYYQKLAAELEKRTSRKVLLERREDASLIAGVVTRIGDHTIDGSLRGRLDALERKLLAST
jgi:F-type H+-transporting ATPase subunit delta